MAADLRVSCSRKITSDWANQEYFGANGVKVHSRINFVHYRINRVLYDDSTTFTTMLGCPYIEMDTCWNCDLLLIVFS